MVLSNPIPTGCLIGSFVRYRTLKALGIKHFDRSFSRIRDRSADSYRPVSRRRDFAPAIHQRGCPSSFRLVINPLRSVQRTYDYFLTILDVIDALDRSREIFHSIFLFLSPAVAIFVLLFGLVEFNLKIRC